MAISVPAGWRPGDALQVPHPLIPNATITVMVPPNAVPGATILLPIPQGEDRPSPVPSAPPQDGPVRCSQQPGRKRKPDDEDKRGMGMGRAPAQAAAQALGVVGGMIVAGALVGEAVQNGPSAAGALIGEALKDGQAAADEVFGGEEGGAAAPAGWANAAADWLENLF